ncbi:site-specific DNA-methyltransferase [Gardnerella sp. KA00735]|uniref:DNA methyltransferase n=1 Tax=Gardnerella sp. KA00735 TaxID=1973156 RepID=UPI000C9F6FA5|nr:site-specific DNA-methyltransferase [Gardnerella sp. KA00735]PNP90190.1 site-specific DNA-methyltransferase [Gardnerella sp. KA00735]
MKNIFGTVAELLLTNDKYKAEDGKLLKAVVYSDVMAMNEDLLTLLLSNEDVKETFFKDVQGTLVFDKQKFAWFMESKEFLPDSYTAYTNKIGLTHNGSFISQTNDIVLDFPYKDCVLEGGQDKDDQKRSEIFYNETIASDEISRMLAPKVFTNAKRYTAVSKNDIGGGAEKSISVEEETGITLKDDDNLIIKGNNLIALASLLKRYEGKVKCIYIDPPYNTQNDSFNYNDSFNHSTWLTFMKNRLELARRLLREDGTIWISCDDHESHYLKVLIDDIFNRDNFIDEIVWQRAYAPINLKKTLSRSHDVILVYAKNLDPNFTLNKLPRSTEANARYKNPDNDPRGVWKSSDISVGPAVESNIYEITTPSGRKVLPPKGYSWRLNKTRFAEFVADNRIWFGEDGNNVPSIKRFLSEVKDGVVAMTLWTRDEVGDSQEGKREIKAFHFNSIFDTPKQERLIERILTLATNEGDLVFDSFIGSGTTAAVAHKMGRRYIGVEQMDYIQDITVERLKKVLEGEQGGISKAQNWHGGGSFVYCELKEDANTLITAIQNATEDTIESVKASIYADERIVPYLTKQELADADKDFENLTLEEKKQALTKLIDKNKLYVNASDMDDESYQISDADKAFTKSFYEEA